MKYLTTDTHFNHDKIFEFCNRPIDYERRLAKGFESLNSTDTLIHLGDICMGNDLAAHEKFIQPIRAKKILIRGNHDNKSDHWYLNNGWDFVCQTFSIVFQKVNILFSHYPRIFDGYFDVNIHGHLHGHDDRDESEKKSHLSISLEKMGYRPISLRGLIDPITRIICEPQ